MNTELCYSKKCCADPELRDSDLCGLNDKCKHCKDDPNKQVRARVQWIVRTGQIDSYSQHI